MKEYIKEKGYCELAYGKEEILLTHGQSQQLMARFNISYPTVRKYLGKTLGEIKEKDIETAREICYYALHCLGGRLIKRNVVTI